MEMRKVKSNCGSDWKEIYRNQQDQLFEITGSTGRKTDFVTAPVNFINISENKLNSAKRFCDELCDWFTLWKENFVRCEAEATSSKGIYCVCNDVSSFLSSTVLTSLGGYEDFGGSCKDRADLT